ncbi:alpha/beta fold hydrolase [Micromonospora sp. CPCC 206171]|uniref:alpha/beta fold hydrolase n=1 Tax=Micromonospora sp. CPCC 206171 TaxID=3122405 RepID=UPI002FF0A31B
MRAMSAPHFVPVATHPELAGHRSLFLDLLGHGLSDRPPDFGYPLEEHAATLATALDHAGVRAADVVAHSMGGGLAVVLAHHRPELVGRLVLVEANLEPSPAPKAGGSGINTYTEARFLASGLAETLDQVGPQWDAGSLTAAGVRALTVPNAGHNVMLDNPEAFARVTAASVTGRARPC